MIGYLKGSVKSYEKDTIVILANNIGWEVRIGVGRYEVGQELELFIHTIVRENDISLWGFTNSEDINLFKKLIQISGIGGKIAQNLISIKGADSIFKAANAMNANELKIPGVGLKTAEKIIFELRSKMDMKNNLANLSNNSILITEVNEGLSALGFTTKQIDQAVRYISKDNKIEELEFDDLFKKLLSVIK